MIKEMRRNCNLELRLATPSIFYRSDYVNGDYNSMLDMADECPDEKQLTIFYNGRIATCEATEVQARSIIMLARREMEEKLGKYDQLSPMGYNSPTTGLSMKRSLQRFLQKRKIRAEATSPYPIARNPN